MKFYRKIILFVFILSLPSVKKAQNNSETFTRVFFCESIQGSEINDIFQNEKGFYWFGTSEGIIRYDGSEIKYYKYKPNETNCLCSNNTTDLLEDEGGIIWVATENGLSKFNYITERFVNYKKSNNNPNSLSSNILFFIFN